MQAVDAIPGLLALAVILIALSGQAKSEAARQYIMRLGFVMYVVLLVIEFAPVVLWNVGMLSQSLHETVLIVARIAFFLVLIPLIGRASVRLGAMPAQDTAKKA